MRKARDEEIGILGKLSDFMPGSDFSLARKYEKLSEMGPCGSVEANIKTGRSPIAHDHFQTPPDPPKGYKNQKKKTNQELI